MSGCLICRTGQEGGQATEFRCDGRADGMLQGAAAMGGDNNQLPPHILGVGH